MELTPQQLCDVEFSEQWRGYNRDQVDDFIERVAEAVSTLQERLRKMTERAVRAEQRLQDGTDSDGGARRTLVLAQRTADATVAEARETAARLIAQAQEEARAILLAAENSQETIPTAEPTARAEIADLEVRRSRLQADVAALESHVTDRRARVKDLLGELQRHVDEGLDWRIAQWPSSSDRILSDEPDEYDDFDDYDDSIDATSAAVDTTSDDDDVDAEADLDDAGDVSVDLAPAPPEWEPQDAAAAPAPSPAPEPYPEAPTDVVDRPREDSPAQADTAGQSNGAAERQDELAMPAPPSGYDEPASGQVDDDTFFAELRGALDDDSPLGPRDDAAGLLQLREEAATAVAEAPSLYDQGEPERRKFGRKKRRQP